MPEVKTIEQAESISRLQDAFRADLDAQLAGGLLIDEIVLGEQTDRGRIRLIARYRRFGRPGTFSAEGETILEAYSELTREAAAERLRVSFEELVGSS